MRRSAASRLSPACCFGAFACTLCCACAYMRARKGVGWGGVGGGGWSNAIAYPVRTWQNVCAAHTMSFMYLWTLLRPRPTSNFCRNSPHRSAMCSGEDLSFKRRFASSSSPILSLFSTLVKSYMHLGHAVGLFKRKQGDKRPHSSHPIRFSRSDHVAIPHRVTESTPAQTYSCLRPRRRCVAAGLAARHWWGRWGQP